MALVLSLSLVAALRDFSPDIWKVSLDKKMSCLRENPFEEPVLLFMTAPKEFGAVAVIGAHLGGAYYEDDDDDEFFFSSSLD